MLQIEQLEAGYGPIQILRGVDLTLSAGHPLALIGRNGVGKTTLLKAIMGLADVTRGRILFDGIEINGLSPRDRATMGLGYVPQTRDIFASLNVEENLIAGLKGRPRRDVDQAYALFPRLAQRRHHQGNQLSGGEQQMLSVARTLLGNPRLLLLDEPLEGLAPIICQELMQCFKTLAQESGVAIILVEQKVDDALKFARDAIVFERGQVVHRESCATLRYRHDVLASLVGVAGD